jgi:hypothetical protein
MNAIEYVPMQVSMKVHKPEKQTHKQVAVQNGTVLYGKADPGLVPEGWHLAELIDVRRFTNAFGERVGLVFSISTKGHAGCEIMESAALSSSPRGKLAELLRGLGGADGSLLTAHELVGHQCLIDVRHEQGRTGKLYAAIVSTAPPT